ncbi:hypothetical protein FGG78_19795 [Thioclava sp. BHET1]|nr:hypothetical protein FGG78_19795 [Thioclava sp. BHET1]
MVISSDHSSKRGRHTLSRRKFLLSSAAVGAFMSSAGNSFAAALSSDVEIQKTAQLLTGKAVDSDLASRAVSALTKVSADFPKDLAALQSFIGAHQISDIEALKATPAFQGKLRQTALDMIGALYLGYAGTPKALSATDDVEFVTYSQALTFQLTHPYTPIPSYSRWSTGYWAEKPPIGA